MTETQPTKRKKAKDGSGSYRQLPDGRWRLRFTLADGRTKDVYGITQAECRNKRRELEQQATGGRDVTQRDPKLGDFLDDWLKWADNGKRAPSTLNGYAGHVKNHLKPALGHIRISKLTVRDVDTLLRSMEDGGLSARTAQQCRTVLNMALKQALRWSMVTHNVASIAEPPKVVQQEFTPLTAEQLRALIGLITDHRYGPLYVLTIATGMRQGELLGLRWEDVDLEAGYLNVRNAKRKAKGGGYELGPTKTPRSRRRIELPGFAIDALEEQRKNQEEDRGFHRERWIDRGYVFTNSIGNWLDGPTVTRALGTILDEAGMSPERPFHGLRHAAATLMARNGVAADVARDVLGHTDIKMTLGNYTHTDQAALRMAADTIGAVITPLAIPAKTEENVG